MAPIKRRSPLSERGEGGRFFYRPPLFSFAKAIRRRPVFTTGSLLALALVLWAARNPVPVFSTPYSTVLLAPNGELLGARLASDSQWRFAPSAAVPLKFEAAITEFEDRRFRRHPGVDPLALSRALRNAWRQGRFTSGGSTLTMQVIRLSRGNPSRTLGEKIVEILLALRLELHLSKSEILSLHAAHAPFGGNVVGLEAASWRYFGRPADRLSWAEACTLAVLPNSPSLIHPGKNRDRLKTKRNRLLARLNSAGKLSNMDLRLALAEPLPNTPHPWPNRAPHLLESLIHADKRGGRTLVVTLDPTLQDAVSDLLARRGEVLERRGIRDAAALILDNRTFQVLAYAGNSRRNNWSDPGDAVDILRRPRSTGSLLKPFLYALALQEGETGPTSLLPDLPTQYAGFRPENIDQTYRGAVPANEALARSLNIPAVRLLRQHGVPRFYASLKALGLSTLFRPADQYGLSLIIGGAEGTLWDLAAAYANLAAVARGDLRAFTSTYRHAAVVQGDSTTSDQPVEFGPGAAWLTQKALVDVARPEDEASWQQYAGARRISWKTGTSQGLRDAWAIGSDGRHTVGVWAGNADGQGIAGLTGGLAAAPILFDIFNRLGPGGWFERPEYDLRDISVCREDGLRPVEGCPTINEVIPLESHFDRQSPHYRTIHLDKGGKWRVHDACESVGLMRPVTWFLLPPGQEYYYRRRHPEYRPLPAYRPDCRDTAPAAPEDLPIAFIYPEEGAQIFIPRELGGERGRTVFEAVHREIRQSLDWHLDGRYLGRTKTFHQQTLDIPPGPHHVTVVDSFGRRLSRHFTIIGPQTPIQAPEPPVSPRS